MSEKALSPEQKSLIEKFGVIQERSGMQPAAARIVALLLINDKPELSFEEIQQKLNLSKSAVSNAINLLLNIGKISYITMPGQRKRYFKSNIKEWEAEMQKSFESLTTISTILSEILAQRPKDTKELNGNLTEVINFLRTFEKEIPDIFSRWKKTQQAG